jgi:hypothetical protein
MASSGPGNIPRNKHSLAKRMDERALARQHTPLIGLKADGAACWPERGT